MSSDDYKIPELPSDEELGIAGLSEEEPGADEASGEATPPPGSEPPRPAPAAPPPEARSPWRGAVTLVVLLVAAWMSSPGRAVPAPVAANAPDSVFSSGRAMAELVEIARAPHPTGSPENARVRGLIVDRLRTLGLDPRVDSATSVVRRGGAAHSAVVHDIVARVPGTSSTGAVLLTAHYDAVPLSHGAGDDGMGVATILETLRATQAGPPLRNDLIILITDGEELGLLGSRAFVRDDPWLSDVSVALSVEMRGGSGPSIMFETGADNGWIIQALAGADPRPFANSLTVALYRRMPNDTDFTPLRESGVQGLNFAAIGSPEIYHQATDVPENVSEGTLEHHGLQVLALTRALGDDDLSDVDAPDRAYFTVPLLGLVDYPGGWSLPITVGLAVLLLAVAALARARGAAWREMVTGLVLGLVTVAGAAGAGWGLFQWLRPRHAEYGTLVAGSFYGEGPYVLGVVAVALVLVLSLFTLARRRMSLGGLLVGALVVPLAATAALTWTVPLGAVNLQVPLAATLLAAALVAVPRPRRKHPVVVWVLTLLLAVPVLVLTVPLTALVWRGFGFQVAPAVGGLAALTLLMLLPALDSLDEPNRWWAPVLALVVAVGSVATGVLRAGPSPSRPQATTLLYVADREAGTARWASRDRGLEWAQSAVGELVQQDSLAGFLLRGRFHTGPAPALQAPPPAIVSRADTAASVGELVVGVASGIGAEVLVLELEEGSQAAFVSVNGVPVPPPADSAGGPVRTLLHWGTPGDTVAVGITTGAGATPVELTVIERLLRPWLLPGIGREPFQRPPGLAPDALRGSDEARVRTRVRLPLNGGGLGPVRTDSVPAPMPDSAGLRMRPDTTPPDTGAVPEGGGTGRGAGATAR